MGARWWGVISGAGARHQTITDPAHRETARGLAHRAAEARDGAERAGAAGAGQVVVERRDLSVYDAVFGISDHTGEVA